MVVEDKEIRKSGTNSRVLHPLDPLSFDEINKAVSIVKNKGNLGRELLFETIALREPTKKEVLAFTPGKKISREVFLVVLDY